MADNRGKHLINNPETCVDDSLRGFVAVHSGVQLLEGHKVVIRRDIDEVKHAGKVTIVTGGGSGHEPAFAGFVGPGMLSAAVCGSVFTSPSPDSVLAAILEVATGNQGGTLLVVMNYTGDRLNFGLAAERAKNRGIKLEMIVIGEDCALTSHDKTAGRRGLSGSLLVMKIAGAMAEEGRSLEEIVSVCEQAAQNMGTIGLCLAPCSIPGQAATFHLGDDEMELGLGAHGEAGVRRLKLSSAKEAVDIMLSHMTNPDSSTRLELLPGRQVALAVNNMGGTPPLEVNIIVNEAIQWLESHQLKVTRAYSGSFLTSLEMMGVSLTVIYLNDQLTAGLDGATGAPAWPKPFTGASSCSRGSHSVRPAATQSSSGSEKEAANSQEGLLDQALSAVLFKAVAYAAEAVGNCENQLNVLDRDGGDGDCGSTLKRGADAILASLGAPEIPGLPVNHPHQLLLELSKVAETSMGGSSGGLYSLLLTAAAGPLGQDVSATGWCRALEAGIKAVMRYGGAEAGDRTMLDPLLAAHEALSENLGKVPALEAFNLAVQAAEEMAKKTATMQARAGRASYVSSEQLTQPDPGAHAVGIWLRAAYQACKLSL